MGLKRTQSWIEGDLREQDKGRILKRRESFRDIIKDFSSIKRFLTIEEPLNQTIVSIKYKQLSQLEFPFSILIDFENKRYYCKMIKEDMELLTKIENFCYDYGKYLKLRQPDGIMEEGLLRPLPKLRYPQRAGVQSRDSKESSVLL